MDETQLSGGVLTLLPYTVKKGSGGKSYMRKGFLIYEEMLKYLAIYEEGESHMTLHPNPSNPS